MAQAGGRLFEGIGRLMTDAVGAADGVKREIDTVVRSQIERILGDLDLVRREEFEAVRDMAANARAENDRLSARLTKLEAELAFTRGEPKAESEADDGADDTATAPANAI
jgi:BMFP domain-containing protein YqiC